MTAKRRPVTPRPRFTEVVMNGRRLGAYTQGGSWRPAPDGSPSSLTVAGETWAVAYHTRLFSAKTIKAPLLGMAHTIERVILCDPTQPPAEMRSTLLHEALHACIAHGRAIDRRIHDMTPEMEESLCCVLERAIGGMSWR